MSQALNAMSREKYSQSFEQFQEYVYDIPKCPRRCEGILLLYIRVVVFVKGSASLLYSLYAS